MVPTDLPPCGLLRRFAVILYDAFLLFAVAFVAGILALPITGPITKSNPFYTTYIFFVCFFFFSWFWTHGGQTLGMRAWRVRIQRYDGKPITWWQALLRFLTAIVSWGALGLGFLWSLFDKHKRTWHDIFSESVLVTLPKAGRETQG